MNSQTIKRTNVIKATIQKEAETAHINIGLKSTCCLGTGLGKTFVLMNRISAILENKPEAKIIVSGAREVYITNTKNEFIKTGKQDLLDKITFICNRSLKNYYKEDWDFIAIDESHKEIDLYLDFLKNAVSRNKNVEILCLTGTPKSAKYFQELYKLVPISYMKQVDESIEDGILNDYRIHIFNYRLTGTELRNYEYWYNRYVNNPSKGFTFELQRIKSIFAKSKQKVEYFKFFKDKLEGFKTLIFANSIEQAESLGVPVMHSKMSKLERTEVYENFYNSDTGFLANVGMLKESVSIPNLTRGVQLNIEASEGSFHQLLGRFCRLSIEEKSHLIILCAENTVEKKWLNTAISKVDKSKVKEYNLDEYVFK